MLKLFNPYLCNAEHVDIGIVKGKVDDNQPCCPVDPQTFPQFLHNDGNNASSVENERKIVKSTLSLLVIFPQFPIILILGHGAYIYQFLLYHCDNHTLHLAIFCIYQLYRYIALDKDF